MMKAKIIALESDNKTHSRRPNLFLDVEGTTPVLSVPKSQGSESIFLTNLTVNVRHNTVTNSILYF